MTVTLAKATRAVSLLKTAAKRADANRDGYLTTREIHAAKGANGKAATDAMLEYHRQHRVAMMNDPEIPSDSMSWEMRHMLTESVGSVARVGLTQLGRIDTYQGNRRNGVLPNTADGVVTDAEIRNYGRTGGRLQLEAAPLAKYAKTLP